MSKETHASSLPIAGTWIPLLDAHRFEAHDSISTRLSGSRLFDGLFEDGDSHACSADHFLREGVPFGVIALILGEAGLLRQADRAGPQHLTTKR